MAGQQDDDGGQEFQVEGAVGWPRAASSGSWPAMNVVEQSGRAGSTPTGRVGRVGARRGGPGQQRATAVQRVGARERKRGRGGEHLHVMRQEEVVGRASRVEGGAGCRGVAWPATGDAGPRQRCGGGWERGRHLTATKATTIAEAECLKLPVPRRGRGRQHGQAGMKASVRACCAGHRVGSVWVTSSGPYGRPSAANGAGRSCRVEQRHGCYDVLVQVRPLRVAARARLVQWRTSAPVQPLDDVALAARSTWSTSRLTDHARPDGHRPSTPRCARRRFRRRGHGSDESVMQPDRPASGRGLAPGSPRPSFPCSASRGFLVRGAGAWRLNRSPACPGPLAAEHFAARQDPGAR